MGFDHYLTLVVSVDLCKFPALAVSLLIVYIKGYIDLPYPSSEEGALPPPLADDVIDARQ